MTSIGVEAEEAENRDCDECDAESEHPRQERQPEQEISDVWQQHVSRHCVIEDCVIRLSDGLST